MQMEASFTRELLMGLPSGERLSELWMSFAYTSVKGVRALRKVIEASEQRRAILGCNAQTEWRALADLQKAGVDVQIMPDPPGRIFHPKCVYAQVRDGPAWVMAGSANLTEGGLRGNIEAGFRLSGPPTLKAIQDARRFFADLSEAAAPLTPDLLNQLREAQEQIQQVIRQAAPGSLTEMAGLDPSRALLLTPSGQRLHRSLDAQAFLNYVRETKMEASYKMVILPLLLQTDEGRLSITALAGGFLRFYQLLAMSGRPPERHPMLMRHAETMTPERAIAVVRGAPREAFGRAGMVVYERDHVEINRRVWAALDKQARMAARETAVARLRQYYRTQLGFTEDFGSLLIGAEFH